MVKDIPPQGSLTFLPHLERRVDSLYAAFDTLLLTEQFETACHLARSLYPYWETYENLSEGVSWLAKLIGPAAKDRFSQSALSSLYAMLGNLLRHQSEYQQAAQYYELGLTCLDEQPDSQIHTFILSGLGEIAFRQGRYEAATGFYQSYLEIGGQVGQDRYVADAFNALGRLATIKGNYAEALEYHQNGKYLCEANDYQSGLAWMLNALGELERARGEHRKAAVHFRESVILFDRLGNRGAKMLALQNLAFALLGEDPSRSEEFLQTTLHFWRRGPARHGLSLSLIGLSRVEISRGNLKKAHRQLSGASQILSQIGVQLELGDRMDYEIALEKLGKGIGQDLFAVPDPITFAAVQDVSFSGHAILSQRETEILRLAAQGLTDKQIAAHVVISPHTVNAHLKSIYRKLSVNNRTSAVAAARSQHLL